MNECPECGSAKIVKDAEVREQGENYVSNSPTVVVFENPDALIFKGASHSTLRAEVCGECGFLQTYVTNPEALWDAYQRSVSNVE